MGSTKALIVGVSNNYLPGFPNLPFCKNDVQAMKQAISQGLNVQIENIIALGGSGEVTCTQFVDAVKMLADTAKEDDNLLFYFSGHGHNISGEHYLVLSDCYVKTQQMIYYLDTIPSKSKVTFLDCCYAGNFDVDGTAVFNIDETVDDFAGKGYAVFASSNASQVSRSHPTTQISLFTSFLVQSLTSRSIIRAGKKSLYDIHRLLFLLLETWNKNNPSCIQTPVYRENIGGTVFFEVEDYQPYEIGSYFKETENYIVHSVTPKHTGLAKRFSVDVILKSPASLIEIATINHEIVKEVRCLDIFSNKVQERLWTNRPANIIFCYFGLDETDIIQRNFICHTTWVDETQDKSHWYRTGRNTEIIDDIHFNVHTYYQSLRLFTDEHTGTKDDIITETKKITHRLITLAEQIISLFNEYQNGETDENGFINCLDQIVPEINTLYFQGSDLDIAPNEIAEWSHACEVIWGSIHDFTLYYNSPTFLKRTPENRRTCMNNSIEQYYRDLETLKALEKDL